MRSVQELVIHSEKEFVVAGGGKTVKQSLKRVVVPDRRKLPALP